MREFVTAGDLKALARTIAWQDLVPMRRIDGAVECLHPLPWLVASWIAAAEGWWLPAMAASFLFFLTALRLNHEAIHGHLGFDRAGHQRVLHMLSLLMLGSNNAVAFNHLQHHAHIGTARDVEGKCGRMSGLRVLVYGPFFPIEMHAKAWRRGSLALRRRMRTDLSLNILAIAAAIASGAMFLLYHVMAMAVAQCLTAFFAVWVTHRGCENDVLVARTQRSRLVNLFTYNMFLHLEHHLFPAVPVRRLGRLAARIDAAAPSLPNEAKRVL